MSESVDPLVLVAIRVAGLNVPRDWLPRTAVEADILRQAQALDLARRQLLAAVDLMQAHAQEPPDAPLAFWQACYEPATPGGAFRMPLEQYTTEASAREHCEDLVRCEHSYRTDLVMDWVEDDSEPDEPRHLIVTGGGLATITGYAVVHLTIAREYDRDADR